jgi:putative endonuclease
MTEIGSAAAFRHRSLPSHPPRVTLGLDPRALYFKMSAMGGFVYILANMRRGRTYIGVTNDLVWRVYEHREGLVEGYTKSRDIKRLVYFEQYDEITTAIQRETSLKRWYSHWKHALIEERNPEWRDLWDDIVK